MSRPLPQRVSRDDPGSERSGRVAHLTTARRLAHALNLAMDELSGKADSIVSDDQPISAEQAPLAVNAAGLDPDKSLNEQLRGDRRGDLEQQAAALSEQVQGAF